MRQRPPFQSGTSYVYHWETKHGGALKFPIPEGDMPQP